MSLDDLKADLATNMMQAKEILGSPLLTAKEIGDHLNNTMWPWLANMVAELEEVDDGLADLYHNAEDILQPETGQLFATVFAGAAGLVGELEKRLTPADGKLVAAIKEWRKILDESSTILAEIIVAPEDDGEEGDPDEDEEGDEDEGDDEPNTEEK